MVDAFSFYGAVMGHQIIETPTEHRSGAALVPAITFTGAVARGTDRYSDAGSLYGCAAAGTPVWRERLPASKE